MKMSDKAKPEPDAPRELHVEPPKQSAVGIPGIAHAMQYALEEMGPRRSLRTLTSMNQADGFD